MPALKSIGIDKIALKGAMLAFRMNPMAGTDHGIRAYLFCRLCDHIIHYFVGCTTSGFVEGLNNKIKVIKRRCYGIYNLGRLFQHIWLDVRGAEGSVH
ncbi:transposase [Methylomonas rhizoryzae]|uniref:transposase n=1 Tax=Methylomonas rhizoryzae TaxID=2608981 RepID=UPI0012319109